MICYVVTHNDSGRRYVGISKSTLSVRKSDHESQAKNRVLKGTDQCSSAQPVVNCSCTSDGDRAAALHLQDDQACGG